MSVSTCLAFPLLVGTPLALIGYIGVGTAVMGDSVMMLLTPGVVLMPVEPASCQAGIVGRGIGGKGLGEGDGTPVGRLSNKTFSDFTSCCNSLRD